MINTTRENLTESLRSYGEEALAGRIAGLPESDLARIGELAYQKMLESGSRGERLIIAKALALAAIEHLEGAPREPSRSRRKLK